MCRTCGKRHNSYEFNPGSVTFHDVSLDSSGSIPLSTGPRSPAKFLPLRGRNMKDYDEQLTHLKNENFSLKLRVYFLEERLGQKEISEEKEDLIKANMEYKVQHEALKKELYDKQELVRQASTLLSSLEAQYKEQVAQIKAEANDEKEDLQHRIKTLEQELVDHCDKCRSISGDLNQLCGLAFNGSLDDFRSDDVQIRPPENSLSSPVKAFGSSPMRGIFSITDDPTLSSMTSEQTLSGSYAPSTDSSPRRIKELEETIDKLEMKVTTLQEELDEKQKHSEALEEDVCNLKKEIEEQEEKLLDLEAEVTEKDEKVDQLMQDLETRHLEIEAKDSTIQNLHDDLTKVEPEIEIKVQEIVERDRIIEEKLEQLQQQNKILVEIQITLDEKQKLIAELEDNLRRATTDLDLKSKELQQSNEKTKSLSEKIATLERESHGMKKDISKKDKKIKDLTAQLKESLDMLQKASWEAETKCRGNDVREMADDEHDGLWAELEQSKADMRTLQASKEAALQEAHKIIDDLRQRAEQSEALLNKWKVQTNMFTDTDIARDKDTRTLQAEVESLRKESKSREEMMTQQKTRIASLQTDLERTREDLNEKKEDLKDLKKELAKKNTAVQDFITNELLGRREELRDLQGKFLGTRDTSQAELKRVLESLNLSAKNKLKGKPPIMAQLRSNSLSEIHDPPTKEDKKDQNKAHSPRPGRSSSFSSLENALFAHMGQKVYNTNQTFNTYVMPAASEDDKSAEGQENQSLGKQALPEPPVIFPYPDRFSSATEPQQSESLETEKAAIQMLYEEMSKIRGEAQALRQEREVLNEKLDCLQSLSNKASRHGSTEKENIGDPDYYIQTLKKQIQENEKQNTFKDEEHNNLVTGYEQHIKELKDGMNMEKKKITLQLLSMASQKHQDALRSYKQEIASLRKRLADSHNACDLMRTKLEELMDYLEELLLLDKVGSVEIHKSKISRKSLAKAIADSRDLSHSLSQSLMIGSDHLSNSIDKKSPKFTISIQDLQEVDLMVPLLEAHSETESEIRHKNDSDTDMSLTCGLTYEDVAAALDSGNFFSSRTGQDITSRLNEMSEILNQKEALIRSKDESIENLKKQMESLQSILPSRIASNEDSRPRKDMKNFELENQLFRTSVPHMSQVDSRLYDKGVLIYPEDTSSSINSDPVLEYGALSTNEIPLQQKLDEPNKNISKSADKTVLLLASPSESEAWSEPDRNVSLARIGLETCTVLCGTERHTSRSRAGRETPLSSESDVEVHVDDAHGTVQAGQGTKYKRRSDATEVKRLTSKLRGVEQVNETLKAELHIYQTLTQHFNSLPMSKPKPDVSDKNVDTELSMASVDESFDLMSLSQPLLQEIQSLRTKLEEAIVNNDLLRDQLEAALAGYLSEETKNLTSNLVCAQTDVRTLKGQVAASQSEIVSLKSELEFKNKRISEIEQSSSICHAKNQELIQTANKLRQELKAVHASLAAREDDLCSLKNIQTLEEENLNMKSMKIIEREAELKSLKLDIELAQCSNLEKQQRLEKQSSEIKCLEAVKIQLEQKISEQNEQISELKKIVTKHEQQSASKLSENTIQSLRESLSRSEARCVQMTKENFAMVSERSRMQAELTLAVAKNDHLQKELNCISESEDSCFSDSSHGRLLERFKATAIQAQKEQKLLLSENQSLKKELDLVKEEFLSLRSHLEHYRSKDSLSTSKCIRELASLQTSSKVVQSQLSAMRNANVALQIEKESLEMKLAKISSRESSGNENKKQRSLKRQLETERMLSRSLIGELDDLKKNATRELTNASPFSTSLEFFHSSPKLAKPNADMAGQLSHRHKTSHRSSSYTHGNNNSRNYLPMYTYNCRSPDLGIGSDGHFSSLDGQEMLQAKRFMNKNYLGDSAKFAESNLLCSDPSHMHLVREKKVLLLEKEELNDHLSSTKDTLEQALEELVHVNKRKETIENAIDRQLSRTSEVLRSSNISSPIYSPNLS